MNDKNEILLGAGEVYMYEFSGEEIPEDATIETPEHNVGHCVGGFSVDYKPTKYDVENQYGETVKSFITKEEVTAKAGILTWDMNNLALLSTGEYGVDKVKKMRTIEFTGQGRGLKTVLLRFRHEKENGKYVRFTMIGQGGSGFSLSFENKELSLDAEITAIKKLDGFLAKFEEELTDEEAAAITAV